MRQPPSVGSMFAGIGGFDLGFEREGFRLAWCIEKDPAAQRVLARRFPSATIYGNITKVDASTLERVDVVCGGFPCQDVSVAGKRAGLAGARTGLFYDAVRIIRQLQPSLLILENVLGLLSSNSGRDFAAVLREVGEGWSCQEVAWRVLDSQYFGVAQRRKRVFVVASAAIGHAEKILALNESVRGDPPTRTTPRQDTAAPSKNCAGTISASPLAETKVSATVADRFGCSRNNYEECVVAFRKSRRAQSNTDCETWVDDGKANTLNAFDTGDTRTTHAVCSIQGNLIGRVDGGPQGVGVSVNEPMYTLTSTDVHAVVFPLDLRNAMRDPEKLDSQNRQGCGIGESGDPSPTLSTCHPPAVCISIDEECNARNDISGVLTRGGEGGRHAAVCIAVDDQCNARLDLNNPLCSSQGGSEAFVSTGMLVRRLTPIECERLQGFPDGWTDVGTTEKPTSDTHRYKQLGNAVTVNVAQWIARRSAECLR